MFGRSGPGKLQNLIKSALVSFFNLKQMAFLYEEQNGLIFFPTAPQGIKEVYIGRFVQSSLLLITKHASKTRPYQLLGWSSQQWWLFLHSVFWWCPIAPLLSGSVHSTTVVEKGRFVQGNFLVQALLKKKENLNHALLDRYRARMLQERRQFNLVNVLVMRRHHDLKYLTQLKILSTIENRFLYHWTGKVRFPTGNNLSKKK